MLNFFMDIFKKHRTLIITAIIVISSFLFLHKGFDSILDRSVPYTYDQGRDFKSARNIIENKDIVLIGPTTGRDGVFHGAPWLYYLAIPYILFNGHPQGFYVFLMLSTFAQISIISWLVKKYLSPEMGLLSFVILTNASYFRSAAVFPISSMSSLPPILLLIFSILTFFYIQKKSSPKKSDKKVLSLLVLMCGLSLGLTLEGEVPMGLATGPAFIGALIVSRSFTTFFSDISRYIMFAGGYVMGISLRLISELKNNFLQTHKFLEIRNYPAETPNTYLGVLPDRISLFKWYYLGLFNDYTKMLGWILFIAALIGLYFGYKKFSDFTKKITWVFFTIISVMFVFTVLYKDNPFFINYYDGIGFFIIVTLMLGLYGMYKKFPMYSHVLTGISIIVILSAGAVNAYDALQTKNVKKEGLDMQMSAVEKLHEIEGKNDVCAYIYTAPILTHTYDYLFYYYEKAEGYPIPTDKFIDDECWYIIEKDIYPERRQDWVDRIVPKEENNNKLLHEYKIGENLLMQKWKVTE